MPTDWINLNADYDILIKEIITIGLPFSGRIRNAVPLFDPALIPEQELTLDILAAAHGKPATDPDVIALRDHLGAGSDEWLALVAIREAAIDALRDDVVGAQGLLVKFVRILVQNCSVVNVSALGGTDKVIKVDDAAGLAVIKTALDSIDTDNPY